MVDAIELLSTRHSYKPIDIDKDAAGPGASEIDTILTIASRVPDHGKLAPWRFIVFEGDARVQAGEKLAALFATANPQATPDQIDFERKRFLQAPLIIAIVSRTIEHPKVPEWEQVLSSGACAINMLLASYALGYVGCWLTEWYAYDRAACDALGVRADEKVTGFVYLGKPARKTESRPRPELKDIVTRFGA